MNGDDNGELPEGWAFAKVSELLDLINGCAFKPAHWKGTGLPIIRIQNLNNPDASFNYCPDAMPEKYRVAHGDLLFAWSGTPGTSFGAHIWRGGEAWLNQHIFRVVFPQKLLDKRFVRHAINQNLEHYIRSAHGGAGLAHITKGMFDDSTLKIPPLAEQRRIVAAVEGVLARVNAARDRLNRVPAILKRFRQSVLSAACSGRLTADWRERYPTLRVDCVHDGNGQFELPASWVWARFGGLLASLRSGSTVPPQNEETPFPILRSSSVRPAVFSLC